jgi:hypothetical protein
MIERINRAAQVGGWNDDRKCSELYLILRERALLWYDGLESRDVNVNNWNALKTAFLETYEPRYTAKTTCASFSELVQKSDESVNDFYNRVHAVVKRLGAMRPAALADVRVAHVGVADDLARTIKTEGTSDERKYWQQLLFTAGLKDELRLKVMDENEDNLADCFKVACDHESLLNERRKTFGVTAISGGEGRACSSWSQDDIDALEDTDFSQVNAIRSGHNMPPLRRSATYRNVVNNSNRSYANATRGSSSASSNTTGGNPMKCRYCKKTGHLQKVCFSRIRNNAPMVDKDGKPYRVNAVNQDAGGESANDANAAAASISTVSAVNHLNW